MSGNQTRNLKTRKQNHNLTIGRMREEDIEDVVVIEKESFSDPWDKRSFMDDLKNPLALPLVAKKDSEVVGYASLWQVEKELQIGNLAVGRKHRREGIARFLMREILKETTKRGCRSIRLDVRESNGSAIRLYDEFGFVLQSKRKNYYRFPEEDALVMLKSL